MLKSEGIDIVAGTDSMCGIPGTAIGPSLWLELEMYEKKIGMQVKDILKSATSVSARRYGFDDRGIIAEGKRADLVLVKGDISTKLSYLWGGDEGEGLGIVGVWKQGLKAA